MTGVPRLAPRLQLGQFYGRRRLVVRVIAGMTSRCSPVTQEALGPPLGAQVECLHLPLDQQKSAAHQTGISGDDFGNWTKILGGLLIMPSIFRPSTTSGVHSAPWVAENRGRVASPGRRQVQHSLWKDHGLLPVDLFGPLPHDRAPHSQAGGCAKPPGSPRPPSTQTKRRKKARKDLALFAVS